MIAVFIVAGFALGFIAALIAFRLPRGLKLPGGGRVCPACETAQPGSLLSYFSFGRRGCENCGGELQSYTLIAALLDAALYAVSFLVYGLTPQLAGVLVLIPLLTALSLIDIDMGILPNSLLLIGVLLGAALSALSLVTKGFGPQPLAALLGAALGAVPLFIMSRLAAILTNTEAMGMGDIKLMGMCGLFIGPDKVIVAVLFGILSCALVLVPLLLMKKISRSASVCFGPFLAGGAVFAYFLAKPILYWYMGGVLS